ncbi:hypothetical protein OJ996_10580 [Luteolibacter sp. GHJ8]|uniref:FG-GAP repeat protein n=1 Tax=Luteolibacter rhizosphaerae TaxID=2989719 RepID=A0ABT3G2G0_9BACT|nr:hypothetical protein [Luteolibacter rhizosphaerae]MCW1914022.1 hypothetical protein [Luteolibacter rhizosphaerae]
MSSRSKKIISITIACLSALIWGLNSGPKERPISGGEQKKRTPDLAPGESGPRAGNEALAGIKMLPDPLQRALEQARRNVFPLSTEEASQAENRGVTHFARNADEGIVARFMERSVSFESDLEESGFTIGYSGDSTGPPLLRTEGSRAEYHHDDGVVEWFQNHPDGIEHGLTLSSRLPGFEHEDAIRINVKLEGVEARTDGDTGDLVFDSSEGKPSFRYSGLKVTDADGDLLAARMQPGDEGICFVVDDRGARYPVTIDPLITNFRQELRPESPGSGSPWNHFGASVAIDEDVAAVGVPQDRTRSDGGTGSVYLFTRQGETWTQSGFISPPENAASGFGASVAIEGDRLLVGAPLSNPGGVTSAGRAYLYVEESNDWHYRQIISVSNLQKEARFGYSVSLSGDQALIGSPGPGGYGDPFSQGVPTAGAAYVIQRQSWGWETVTQLLPPGGGEHGDLFGFSVALDGSHAFVGSPGDIATTTEHQGSAHIFTKSQETWDLASSIRVPGGFNQAAFGCAVAAEGNTLVIGAHGIATSSQLPDARGNVYIFTGSLSTWFLQQKLSSTHPADARLGFSVAIDGDTVIAGATARHPQEAHPAGSALVYTRSGVTWTQGMRFDSQSGQGGGKFGAAVAISGNNLLIGAPQESSTAQNHAGRVHTYRSSGSDWNSFGTLVAEEGGDDFQFGSSVAISGNRAVIGTPQEDSLSGADAGCAYVFRDESGSWVFEDRLDPGGVIQKQFGISVALDGDRALVGASDFAVVYKRTEAGWSLEDAIVPTGATGGFLGSSVALLGGRAVFGIPSTLPFGVDRGRVWIFERDEDEWIQSAELVAAGNGEDDHFGMSVALRSGTVLVGRPGLGAGSVHVFSKTNGVWGERTKLQASDASAGDRFGYALSIMNGRALIGAPWKDIEGSYDAGAVYLFEESGTSWLQRTRLKAPVPAQSASFGAAVAAGHDRALIGSPGYLSHQFVLPTGRGTADLFTLEGGLWSHEMRFAASHESGDSLDGFGRSVALSRGTALVGASHMDRTDIDQSYDKRSADQGSVFIYQLGSEEAYLVETYDMDQDGGLSLAEWQEIPAVKPKKETAFPLIDSDASGSLSVEEILAARSDKKLAKSLGLWLQRTELFVELDVSRDDVISRAEIAVMWKPGTAEKTIASFWSRMGGGSGMELKAWIKTKAIPSIPGYAVAKAMRTQRREVAADIDTDEDERISREEFAILFKLGTPAAKIDVAWMAATATPKGGVARGSISIPEFVEAAKLPKLP